MELAQVYLDQSEISHAQLYGGGAAEAGQFHALAGGEFQVPREGQAELRRREPRGGVEQRDDAGGVDPVVLLGDADVEEAVAQAGTSGAVERGLERAEWDVVEGDR